MFGNQTNTEGYFFFLYFGLSQNLVKLQLYALASSTVHRLINFKQQSQMDVHFRRNQRHTVIKGHSMSQRGAAQSLYSLYAVRLVKDTRLGHYYLCVPQPLKLMGESTEGERQASSPWIQECTHS
ncbi:hypothetical protein QOT17_024036 [Balamuthia mandrillaris]